MPVGFARSLLGGSATSTGARASSALITGNPGSGFSGTSGLFGSASFTDRDGTSPIRAIGDNTITVYPSDSNFKFNSNFAWTIEFFIQPSSLTASNPATPIFNMVSNGLQNNVGSYYPGIAWGNDGTAHWRFYNPSGGTISNQNFSSTVNWFHIAAVSTGTGTFKWFYNGSTFYTTSSYTDTRDITAFSYGAWNTNYGVTTRLKWDEMRISNIARYSGSYTVPTAAFTNDSNTLGLFHFDGTDTDDIN